MFAAFTLMLVSWVNQAELSAQDPGSIEAFLRAGEFAPALRAAEQLPQAHARDQWLGKIARQQARFGARRASLATASNMLSDVERTQALDEIGAQPVGGRGGAALADFDTLIELITSTIAPDSWDEVGGAGAIEPFPTGVFVDPSGVARRMSTDGEAHELESLRREARKFSENTQARKSSSLRKVSLTRLEKQVQLLRALGRDPQEEMQLLAGMYQVKYVLVYPDSNEVVIAGPAGDWIRNGRGQIVNTETGIPVLQLDDLVVLLRNAFSQHTPFGCAITPTQENLAKAQSFLARSAESPVRPGRREQWVEQLRDTVGLQEVTVFGIDPTTRVARVLVEADYHMKLIGMGLEEGTLGVKSYLQAVKDSGRIPTEMSVLRWWFAVNYDAISTTAKRDAYEIKGQGVQVLSENELLADQGQRIHTGKSDELNRTFTDSFTSQFPVLAQKYPIYAELKNIFDLAVVAAILKEERLPDQVDWHLTHFGSQGSYQVRQGQAPAKIRSVVNHINVTDKQFLAGVSGGVRCDTRSLATEAQIETDEYGLLTAERSQARPQTLPRNAWWWD